MNHHGAHMASSGVTMVIITHMTSQGITMVLSRMQDIATMNVLTLGCVNQHATFVSHPTQHKVSHKGPTLCLCWTPNNTTTSMLVNHMLPHIQLHPNIQLYCS